MNGKHLLLFQTNQNKCTSTANWLGVAGRGVATPPNGFSLCAAMAILHPEEAAPATQIFINCNSTGAGRDRGRGRAGRGEGRGAGTTVGNWDKVREVPVRRGPSKRGRIRRQMGKWYTLLCNVNVDSDVACCTHNQETTNCHINVGWFAT